MMRYATIFTALLLLTAGLAEHKTEKQKFRMTSRKFRPPAFGFTTTFRLDSQKRKRRASRC